MIKTPTVLILGAGASNPYGFPLGKQLVNEIVRDASNPVSDLVQDLKNVPQFDFAQREIERFGVALRGSASYSIDAFLESRTDFKDMGRCAIASKLLRCEDPYLIFQEKTDWYHYLYDKMRDSNQFESFGENKLSIVTFNYDRSLEFFLFTALQNSFQKTSGECAQILEKIPIIHLHGRLGPPPTGQSVWNYGTPIPPIQRQKFLVHLPDFAKQIKIIHEVEDSTPEFKTAQEHLSSARRICFLGFGYQTLNLKRLMKGVAGMHEKEIYCGGYILFDKEKVAISRAHFNTGGLQLNWGKAEHKCEEFLREWAVLLE